MAGTDMGSAPRPPYLLCCGPAPAPGTNAAAPGRAILGGGCGWLEHGRVLGGDIVTEREPVECRLGRCGLGSCFCGTVCLRVLFAADMGSRCQSDGLRDDGNIVLVFSS